MADTNFTAKKTKIKASWLNEVNNLVHKIFGNPADKASARNALGADSQSDLVTITPGSDGDVTLSAAENASTVRVLETGSWTATHSLIGDDVDRQFVVINNSGYTATITTDGTTPTTYDVPSDGLPYTLQSRAGAGVELVGNDVPETGTFNASIAFGGASTGITYNKRECFYVKRYIGGGLSLVYAFGLITLTDKGTATGNATISSLPFTIYLGSVNNYYVPTALRFDNITYTGQYSGYTSLNGIGLVDLTEAGSIAFLQDTDFANDSSIMFSLSYLTED